MGLPIVVRALRVCLQRTCPFANSHALHTITTEGGENIPQIAVVHCLLNYCLDHFVSDANEIVDHVADGSAYDNTSVAHRTHRT